LADLTRFHEAIDQSIAEAVHRHSEHIDKSRQMFLGILAHDLRTPLNAITMMAQSLVETESEGHQPAETASQILSSADAVARILNDFLDFAVPRLGRPIPVAPAEMDLAALCREVVAEARASCPRCHWRVDSPNKLRGEWDRARLRQLLSNLINNAVQHGDTTSEISVSVANDGSRATLSVHNDGPPIPEEFLLRVFDPNVRGPNSGARDGSVGLGLYIAREVAVAHGGAIKVTSTREAGTTFTVILPLHGPHLT
jgi:signal transduction histidine kinase